MTIESVTMLTAMVGWTLVRGAARALIAVTFWTLVALAWLALAFVGGAMLVRCAWRPVRRSAAAVASAIVSLGS